MTMDLLARAQAGDEASFAELVAPYRRELHVHCYRILGSTQDAEDALQETLLAAWRSLGGFEGRASLRTWLYRVATNHCLNALRAANRRPRSYEDRPDLLLPQATPASEPFWLEPTPIGYLTSFPTRRRVRTHATSCAKRSRSPSSPPYSYYRHGSAAC